MLYFSDEVDCNVYEKDTSYMKEVPPEPVEGNLTRVQVDVDVLAILAISEVDSYITMQMSLRLTW